MINISTHEDEIRGIIRYELSDGRRLDLHEDLVREHGLERILKEMDLESELEKERVPVQYAGRIVGTLPPNFDAVNVISLSMLYRPRRGDIRREGAIWIASDNIGPGDLKSIAGFRWETN